MKKETKDKKIYETPFIEVFKMNGDTQLMAGSPPVKPNISIEDPEEDEDDTEISGAKKINIEWDSK